MTLTPLYLGGRIPDTTGMKHEAKTAWKQDKSGFNDRDADQITTVFSSSLLLNSLIMRLLPSYTLVTDT